jgi:ribosomal RNA-processing protein 9
MPKRPAKGRSQVRSRKAAKGQNNPSRKDDIDWDISSGEGSDSENMPVQSASDQSDVEESIEDNETAEEKKLRLAKEIINKVRLEEEEKDETFDSEEDTTDDDGVERRVEERLQRKADEVIYSFLYYF